jgi:hypothetical protein
MENVVVFTTKDHIMEHIKRLDQDRHLCRLENASKETLRRILVELMYKKKNGSYDDCDFMMQYTRRKCL